MYCPRCKAAIKSKNGTNKNSGKVRYLCENGHETVNPISAELAARRRLIDEMIGDHTRSWTEDELIDILRQLKLANPSKHITRNFFRTQTEIPDSAWSHIFGTFSEFIRQADVALSRQQHQLERHIAKHRSVDHYRRANERHEWGEDFLRPSTGDWLTLVCASDFHDIECDPFWLRVLVDTVRWVQPDVVNITGDLFDLPEFGKYNVDPRQWDVVGRIREAHKQLDALREAAPDAQFDFIEGNHELRLIKHLVDQTPAMRTLLAELHGMDTRQLLGLDKFGLNYISKADLGAGNKNDLKREIAKNYKIYADCFCTSHYPMYNRFEMAGVNGHHHKIQVTPVRTLQHHTRMWAEHGCGHMLDASFCDGDQWQLGFSIVDIHKPTMSVNIQVVPVTHIAQVGGKYYERQANEMVGVYRDQGASI